MPRLPHRWQYRSAALLAGWWLAVGPAAATAADDGLGRALARISGARMALDVARLSGPDFNGRQTGTADDWRAARFVARQWAALGLQPAGFEPLPDEPAVSSTPPASLTSPGGAWAQTEPVLTTRLEPECRVELALGGERVALQIGTEYLPILDSPAVGATAPVVFVGYGIADPARGLDEYEGLDVRNRVVLFLRGKPEWYPAPITHADKERAARERGAVAFLTATGPLLSAYEARRGVTGQPAAFYGGAPEGERPLPGAWISTALAERLLAAQGLSLRAAQERIASARRPQSVALTALVSLRWAAVQEPGRLVNVLALLPGRDPAKQRETVVLGAHRDHFGRQAGLLFPGADDNASGTAVLLEVARALTEAGLKPRRPILFISFSGEEQGLLGSRAYVRHPSRPLASTLGMVNVDHAGAGNGRLTVGVTQVPKETAAEAGRRAGSADRLDLYGFFPGGDHVPFKEAGVPTATVVTGGPHPHFHQPTDTADLVNPDLLASVARYVLALVWSLADAP